MAIRPAQDLPDKTQTSLDVVLRCFVAATDADSGVLLGINPRGRAELLAAAGHAARRATVPWTRGTFLAQAFAGEGVSLEPASGWHPEAGTPEAWHAVACTIPGRTGTLGAIYAGFDRPSRLSRRQLTWAAEAHAQLAGMCMSEGGEAIANVLRSSGVDQLTGCLRYERVIEMLKSEIQRSTRQGHDLSCCFFDIDHFKAINDEHGHVQGNRVLASAGDALNACARAFDCVGRFGGDEFVVVMPETSSAQAEKAAARMRAAVQQNVEERTGLKVTVSSGVSQWRRKDTMLQLLEASDRALQLVKAGGSSSLAPVRAGAGGLRSLVTAARSQMNSVARGRNARR